MPAATPERVRVQAPAKLNLFLHVGEKRPDGFHDLQSLVVFAEVGDTLEFGHASSLSFLLKGSFADALRSEGDNLVLKAARALAARDGMVAEASILLTKELPVASGIGGGSADAAAALRGLAVLWRVENATPEWSARIGSDVPVCLLSEPAWMEGRGERVSPIAPIGGIPLLDLVLVNPGVAVATAEIFRRLEHRSGVTIPPRAFAGTRELLGFLRATRNDLEAVARTMVPEIAAILATLEEHGAQFVRMSGSGATCYGIFESSAHAASAARAISRENPSWWTVSTRFAPAGAGQPLRL